MGKNYKPPAEDSDFEKWWMHYPRKVAKGDARKAWIQTASIRPPTENMIKAIVLARNSESWIKDAGMFIPYPATWLRDERWDDVHEIDLANVVNGKMWWETATGIETKGRELGMSPEQFPAWPEFKVAVFRACGVTPLKKIA